MTDCIKGEHQFPIEDDTGAYCPEHGVTILWRRDPLTPDEPDPGDPPHTDRPSVPTS